MFVLYSLSLCYNVRMATEHRMQLFEKVANRRQRDIVVVMEDIFDPHNAEAIIRTCDGFGIQTAYLIFDTTDPFNPRKVGKATSSSANKWLDFIIYKKQGETVVSPAERCLSDLKKQGFTVVATALTEKAQNLYEFVWPEKIALLVGNEHAGLSQRALELSDFHVQIPMQGFVQSLNVSVSTAIFLSEIYRSRIDKRFSIPKSEQVKLVQDYSNR